MYVGVKYLKSQHGISIQTFSHLEPVTTVGTKTIDSHTLVCGPCLEFGVGCAEGSALLALDETAVVLGEDGCVVGGFDGDVPGVGADLVSGHEADVSCFDLFGADAVGQAVVLEVVDDCQRSVFV